jgi:hypothetical protein
MHWLGSNVASLLFVVTGGLWAFWAVLLAPTGARAADGPASSEKGGAGTPAEGQRADWGARLNVLPGGVSPAQKRTAASGVSGGQPSGPAPLAIPLVQGYDSFGLNLPDHDAEGRLRSVFVIGAISRIDDRNVEIRESFLETYAENGSPEFSIELPKATLDRFTRVLVAKTPVTLRKAEFELKGASLEFNTVTKEGGLGGPVRMTIYNGVPGAAPQKAGPPSPSVRASPPIPR